MDVSRFDDELQEWLRHLDEAPNDLDLIARVCYALNIRSFHQPCIELARKGLAKDPYHAGLYYELIIASSLDTAHILEAFVQELERLLEARPNAMDLRRNLALVHYYLENDTRAEEILFYILNHTGGRQVDRETYEVLAQLEYTRQNMEQCIDLCDKAIDRPGPSARMVRLKGLCYQEMGDWKRAMSCFLFALELEGHFVWACHSLAVLCVERQEYDQALRFFGKATYINPKDPGNLFLLAEAFIDMEAYDLAAAELHKLLMLKPEKRIEAEVHNALGYVYIRKGEVDRAGAHLSHAIDLEPELAVAYYNLGRLAMIQNLHALAERHFKNALKLDGQHVESLLDLGFLYHRQKQYDQARQCFENALHIDPDEPQAFLGLSKISQDHQDPESQLKLALCAYELDPDHADICNNLGIAYECNQDLDRAEEAYRQALEEDPDHSAAANNLGYLYEKKMKNEPDQKEHYRAMALDAWKTRLRICAKLKKSTLGAKSHLRKLGLSRREIDRLEQELTV